MKPIQLTSESMWKTYSILKEDYETLVQYYSQIVPMQGTSGKYCINHGLVYPRYKIRASFEIYNQANPVNKRALAKNEGYADYVVVPAKDILEVLSKGTLGKNTAQQDCYKFVYIPNSRLNTLKIAISHYNSINYNRPIIDFKDFTQNLEDLKERLTIDKASYLVDLLNGDEASVKLAMESLTNYDTKRSLIAILYILSKGKKIRLNDYFNSTAFKSFRNKMMEITKVTVEYWLNMDFNRIYKNLADEVDLKKVTLTMSEYSFIRAEMHQYCMDIATNSGVTLNLKEEDVILGFSPENIIPDEVVQAEDEVRQKALLEDSSDTYLLVDDTADNL